MTPVNSSEQEPPRARPTIGEAAKVLADPSAYADDDRLHSALTHLRANNPVAWVDNRPYRPFWAITKHADILAVERDNELFISEPRPLLTTAAGDDVAEAQLESGLGLRTLIHMDDPHHRKVRAIDEPFRFDGGRDPNKHVAFGAGVHFCLGAALARMEMNSLFTELVPRLESIELAGRQSFPRRRSSEGSNTCRSGTHCGDGPGSFAKFLRNPSTADTDQCPSRARARPSRSA